MFKYHNTCCSTVSVSIGGEVIDRISYASGDSVSKEFPKIVYAPFNGGDEFRISKSDATLLLFYAYTCSESCPSEEDDDASERLKFNECMQLKASGTIEL